MKPIRLMLMLLLALAGLAAGCNTFQTRATEKAAVFGALDPATQARLKAGDIQLGDSMDLVYIALGAPDEKRDQLTAEGSAVVWIYHTYWEDYRGEGVVGYRPVPAPGVRGGPTPPVIYEPITRGIYEDREKLYLRLTFKAEKLITIEKPKQ